AHGAGDRAAPPHHRSLGCWPPRPGDHGDRLACAQCRAIAHGHWDRPSLNRLRCQRQTLALAEEGVMLTRLSGGILAAFAIASAVAADGYPSKPITIVVPFAAGGPNDVLARLVSEHMSRTLTQPVLVENAAGAGGTIGSARVAKAQGDGYTLLSGNLGSLG